MSKNMKLRTMPVTEPYEIYASISYSQVLIALNRFAESIEMAELKISTEEIKQVPADNLSYSERFRIWQSLSIDKLSNELNSAIAKLSNSEKLSLRDKLSHTDKLNHTNILSHKDKPIHSIVQLFPKAELFYVRKHYAGVESERKDQYARVLASYVGPHEQDRAGHDIYLSELASRGYLVHSKADIYRIPDIYQFEVNNEDARFVPSFPIHKEVV